MCVFCPPYVVGLGFCCVGVSIFEDASQAEKEKESEQKKVHGDLEYHAGGEEEMEAVQG